MKDNEEINRKALQKLLLIFLAAALLIGTAVYSKLRYTTFNYPKVLAAKAALGSQDFYELSNETYMLRYKESYESTLGRFIDDIGGSDLRYESVREAPEWLFELDGETCSISILNRVDLAGSYLMVSTEKI